MAPIPVTEHRAAAPDPGPDAPQTTSAAAYSLTASTASLRLGLNVGLLPWSARWFYMEAVGTAIRRNDRWTLDRVQPAEELARLLEIAQGSERIVEIGAQTGWTALALAATDERRSVISFRHPGASQGPERYAHLVDAGVRARIGSRAEPAERVPRSIPGPADLAHVDLSPPCPDMRVGLLAAGLVVRPGGLVVVRGASRSETVPLVEELDLETSVLDGLIVGRASIEPDRSLLEETLPPLLGDLDELAPRTRARHLRLIALGLAGALVGAGAGLVLPLGDSLVSSDRATSGDDGSPALTSTPKAASRRAAPAVTPPRTRSAHRSSRGITAYSGTGPRKLGTIRVNQPMYMRWNTGGGSFKVVSEAWGFRPRTREGKLLLSPGAYRRFEVRGTGSWRLELTKP